MSLSAEQLSHLPDLSQTKYVFHLPDCQTQVIKLLKKSKKWTSPGSVSDTMALNMFMVAMVKLYFYVLHGSYAVNENTTNIIEDIQDEMQLDKHGDRAFSQRRTWLNWAEVELLQFQGSGTVYAGSLSNTGLLRHFIRTLIMLFATPVLFLQWQVKIPAVKKLSRTD